MAITFAVIALVMAAITAVCPLARPKELPVKEGFSMTPAPSVAWVGASVVITVAVLYVIFW
jgi:hypothetical protein